MATWTLSSEHSTSNRNNNNSLSMRLRVLLPNIISTVLIWILFVLIPLKYAIGECNDISTYDPMHTVMQSWNQAQNRTTQDYLSTNLFNCVRYINKTSVFKMNFNGRNDVAMCWHSQLTWTAQYAYLPFVFVSPISHTFSFYINYIQ